MCQPVCPIVRRREQWREGGKGGVARFALVAGGGGGIRSLDRRPPHGRPSDRPQLSNGGFMARLETDQTKSKNTRKKIKFTKMGGK